MSTARLLNTLSAIENAARLVSELPTCGERQVLASIASMARVAIEYEMRESEQQLDEDELHERAVNARAALAKATR